MATRYGLTYTTDTDTQQLYLRSGPDVPGHNGDGSWTLPASATFVIGTDGRVAYRSVTADYRWRIGPAEVVAALDELSSNHEAVASPAGSGDPSTQRG